jgi:hypothetical protein
MCRPTGPRMVRSGGVTTCQAKALVTQMFVGDQIAAVDGEQLDKRIEVLEARSFIIIRD